MLHGANNLLETGCGVGVFGCVIMRRSHPQRAAVVAGGGLAVAALGSSAAFPGSLILVPVILLAYSLGTAADPRRSALALAILGAGLQLSAGQFNPIVVVLTIGPYAVGLVIRSRRRLTEQLAARGQELEAERALFAAEAVRYERARIAREPDAAADAAYRVVQESLTNAFKHAPGSPVDVVIEGARGHVEIGVVNGPATGPQSGLELTGTGRGLTGMRERVAACGGQISAGPVTGGGWQVLARLPLDPGQARSSSLS